MSALPKAALYYSSQSIWASVPLLTLEEKGYGDDEVDLKQVDISKGENFEPTYLRLNPAGTVPTLVVPLDKTLSPEIESRYKAVQDTKSIVELLDKSRSAQSRTNTTSSAPSPSLAPATIAFSAASNQIIDLLHSQAADPNTLFYMNARSESELKSLAKQLIPFLVGRRDTLSRLLSENDTGAVHVSEKTKAFWQMKKMATENFLQVFEQAGKDGAELASDDRQRREEYLESSQAAWTALKDVLATLDSAVLGPYTLGDQLSIADLHLAAWIARIAFLSGAIASEDGTKVLGRIEAHVGNDFTLPKEFSVAEARRRAGLPANVECSERQSKLAAFWDSMRERPSWKKVYSEGLH